MGRKLDSTLPTEVDRQHMCRALALARRAEGRVEPNPMVGCVIARGARVLGEGCHRCFGGPHAEVEALRACTENPRGATVYVTLEPCNHHGKTPPCTEALIAARVGRVQAAVRDPNPALRGNGAARLRRAGIPVEFGLEAQAACRLLAPYLTSIHLPRPYVIAKWAQSLDGKLATRTGDSRWISGEASRRRVHKLRARVDAILVGAETARRDDPQLTARGVPLRRRAVRVVLDGKLRLSLRAQLVRTAREVPTWVFTSSGAARSAKARQLTGRGVEVIPVKARGDRLVLLEVLKKLHRRAVTNLMVEGGAGVLSSFFTAGLIDEALVFVAPMLIGGADAPAVLAADGVRDIAAALRPASCKTSRSGSDTLWHLRWDHLP